MKTIPRLCAAALAATLSAAALISCSVDLTPPGRRYALVYGVTTYTTNQLDTGYPNLNYPDIDATSVYGLLAINGYDEVIRKIRNATLDESPTKANLVIDLAYFASIITPIDTFMLYFSGHGTSANGHKYIIPYLGVDGSDPFTFNPGLSVSEDDLGAYLEQIPTARKIVILDSCYSGGFISNPLEVDLTPPGYINKTDWIIEPAVIAKAIQNYASFSASGSGGISPYGNAIVISAAGSNEYSFEYGAPYGHGIATYFYLRSPQSGDLNGDGLVTAMEAFSLIKAGMDQEWNSVAPIYPLIDPSNPDPDYHDTYAPHISGGPLDYGIFLAAP